MECREDVRAVPAGVRKDDVSPGMILPARHVVDLVPVHQPSILRRLMLTHLERKEGCV